MDRRRANAEEAAEGVEATEPSGAVGLAKHQQATMSAMLVGEVLASEPTPAVLSSLAAARPGDHSDRLQRPCAPYVGWSADLETAVGQAIPLVVVVAGLNPLGANAERQAISPTDDACTTMLDYFRAAPGGEDKSDAWDRLRYVRGRLDNATAPDAVTIRDYLAPYRLNGGPGTGNTELVPVLGPDEVKLVRRMSAQLMRAAQASAALPLDALEPVEAQ